MKIILPIVFFILGALIVVLVILMINHTISIKWVIVARLLAIMVMLNTGMDFAQIQKNAEEMGLTLSQYIDYY